MQPPCPSSDRKKNGEGARALQGAQPLVAKPIVSWVAEEGLTERADAPEKVPMDHCSAAFCATLDLSFHAFSYPVLFVEFHLAFHDRQEDCSTVVQS